MYHKIHMVFRRECDEYKSIRLTVVAGWPFKNSKFRETFI